MEDPDIKQAPNRRPVAARSHPAIRSTARWLQKRGVAPNFVSVASVVFAAGAGGCLAATARVEPASAAGLFVLAIAGIALRGLCNVVDGLIAVEGGLKSKSGDLYNDFPDRISDTFLCVGAGYAVTVGPWGPELGWAAALTAVMTAYTRVLGGSAGATQSFSGPMSKTHRMAVLCAASVGTAVELFVLGTNWTMVAALALIVAGGIVTTIRRLQRASQELENR